jgi:hypothetical protein
VDDVADNGAGREVAKAVPAKVDLVDEEDLAADVTQPT